MSVATFDDRPAFLGEGPLWHPERAQLFWFDIMGKRLMTRTEDGPAEWVFDRHVSAAGGSIATRCWWPARRTSSASTWRPARRSVAPLEAEQSRDTVQ
jgi:sugar lactone lactonase YvrE